MSDPISYHDTLAANWDERYLRGGFARRARLFAERILPLLPRHGRSLDAGCGSGTFSRILADTRDVVGVDASEAMLAEAMDRSATLARPPSFHSVATIEKLPFESQSFEGILCLSVLEYVDNPKRALLEMSRVVKQGGTVVISVPHRLSIVRQMQAAYVRVHARSRGNVRYLNLSKYTTTPREMRRFLGDCGLVPRWMLTFDTLIPSKLHWLLKPSLIYAVCEKSSPASNQ